MGTTRTAGTSPRTTRAHGRLHHLSTWKAELKVLVASAQRQSEELSLKGPSTTTVSPLSLSTSTLPRAATSAAATGERVIFHVDFDCFFVSCGLATRPHLKGKPSVVCHSQAGRGASSTSEIASASYEARVELGRWSERTCRPSREPE
jgi:DNA repair protein REV1